MNKKIEKILKQEWVKTSTRRMTYQKMRLYQYGLYSGFKKVFGLRQHYYLNRVKKGNVFSYNLKSEVEGQYACLLKKFTNPDYVKNNLSRLEKNLKRDFGESIKEIKKLNKDWRASTNLDLIKAFKKYYQIDNSLSIYYWVLFNEIENILTEAVQILMTRRGIGEKDIKRAFSALSKPSLCVPLDLERLSLLKVSLVKGKKRIAAFRKHCKKFEFLPMYDIDYDCFSRGYFERELEKIEKKNTSAEIKNKILEIKIKYAARKKESARIINKYGSMPEIFSILNFFVTFANYKDRKPYVRDQIAYHVKGLFSEISQRLALTLSETLFMTEKELQAALAGKRTFSKSKLQGRINDSAYLLQNDKVTIISNKSDLKIIDNSLEKKEITKGLGGIGVSPGNVQGSVAVILSNADFSKFKKGQILVASATRPDYVPIMKKAAAVVTDEGGMLSHAAIVSRELGIPCVVGTKKATLVLRDGDLVEVDANNGVVKILKR